MLRMEASPPGPALQKINAALHREPVATIAYGCFWCVALIVGTPTAITVLLIRMLYRLGSRRLQQRRRPHDNDRTACDPAAAAARYEMAVVITGCDSGFGREFALSAADAGYTVFAGCLQPGQSWEGLIPDRIIPVAMDVTSDNQVQDVVAKVQAWLNDDDGANKKGSVEKKRVMHALINNAGVGTGGFVDWTELSDFQFCIDGTHDLRFRSTVGWLVARSLGTDSCD